ncbi:MAG: hypothetical protein ACTSQF_01910 [Candidatus Heimdallarchaeaceae archaeon]
MKLKVSKIVPKGFAAITLCPFGIYFSEEKYLNNKVIVNHEKIHWKQQVEMLVLPFYLWYGIEWFIKTLKPLLKINLPKSAYYSLSFEREANNNENNADYLKTRKCYAWFKHVFKK